MLKTLSSWWHKCWARVLALPAFVWRLAWVLYFFLALFVLAMRWGVLPRIEHERARVEAMLSREIGLDVHVGAVKAEWSGLRPRLELKAFTMADRQSRQALSLARVDAELGWSSLLFWRPILHHLDIYRPELSIRREVDGSVFVAGFKFGAEGGGGGFSDFVLAQPSIRIHEACVSWIDSQRGAPPLVLDKLSLRLDNDGDKHRFALLASPPAQWSGPLDLRGNLRGRAKDGFKAWRGTLYLSADHAELAAWKPWVDYPVPVESGRVGLRAWLNLEAPKVMALTADLAAAELKTRLAGDLPDLNLKRFSGRIKASQREGDVQLSGERLKLLTGEGEALDSTNFSLRSRPATAKEAASFDFKLGRVDLGLVSGLASRLPLPAEAKARLGQLKPRGQLEALAFFWQKGGGDPRFRIDASFKQLGLEAMEAFPGVKGFSGRVQGDERQGSFRLDARAGAFDLPRVMPEAIRLDKAKINGGWGREKAQSEDHEALVVKLDSLAVSNPDAEGEFSGFWRSSADGPGFLDLHGSARRAKASAAIHYLPHITPKPVVDWLAQGLRGGRVDKVDLLVRGPLKDFPFRKGGGVFRISGDISDAEINFAQGWLGFKAVQGKLLFEGSRMLITARTGRYLNAQARGVSVEIPDMLDAGHQLLRIDGKARGSTSDFLHYVSHSQLDEMAGGFTRGIQAQGMGDLDLHIEVPLAHAEATRVKGEYRFAANHLRLISQLPEFSNASGALLFTEAGLGLRGGQAMFLGRALHASGQTEKDGTLHFVADGNLTNEGLRQLVQFPGLDRLRGESAAHADIRVKDGQTELRVSSNLLGMASGLPAPMRKDAASEWPSSFVWRASEAGKGGQRIQSWQLELDRRLSLAWEDRCAQTCTFSRGALAYGTRVDLPAQGWRVAGVFGQLDLEPWRAFLVEFGRGGSLGRGASLSAGLAFEVKELFVAGHRFRDISGKALREDGLWHIYLTGPQIEGDLIWHEEGRGMLQARLKQLILDPLPVSASAQVVAAPGDEAGASLTELPALDVKAEKFGLRKLDLGSLQLSAVNVDNLWRLQKLSLSSSDFSFEGSGQWRAQGPDASTHLDFELDSKNVGSMLGRLGYANMVREGQAKLKGKLDWRGPPSSIHYPSLSGSMKLHASDGRFDKLEPGAGRLLGLLSLQFLPRRLTLDFRDIFSDGFAFETIKGNMEVKSGVMRTQDLEIKGAAAQVRMQGSTDLGREVHDLRILVQPTLTETVAVGVAVSQAAVGVINPVVGLAAYLAQKVLKDPVEKIFSYEYEIKGPWSDPQVEKAGSVLKKLPEAIQSGVADFQGKQP